MSNSFTANASVETSLEIGVITLGEFLSDPHIGKRISARQRVQEIVAAAKLADEAGLDIFGVGEHHSLDFVASAVPVVLAAIAPVTRQIRLTSAVRKLNVFVNRTFPLDDVQTALEYRQTGTTPGKVVLTVN